MQHIVESDATAEKKLRNDMIGPPGGWNMHLSKNILGFSRCGRLGCITSKLSRIQGLGKSLALSGIIIGVPGVFCRSRISLRNFKISGPLMMRIVQ